MHGSHPPGFAKFLNRLIIKIGRILEINGNLAFLEIFPHSIKLYSHESFTNNNLKRIYFNRYSNDLIQFFNSNGIEEMSDSDFPIIINPREGVSYFIIGKKDLKKISKET